MFGFRRLESQQIKKEPTHPSWSELSSQLTDNPISAFEKLDKTEDTLNIEDIFDLELPSFNSPEECFQSFDRATFAIVHKTALSMDQPAFQEALPPLINILSKLNEQKDKLSKLIQSGDLQGMRELWNQNSEHLLHTTEAHCTGVDIDSDKILNSPGLRRRYTLELNKYLNLMITNFLLTQCSNPEQRENALSQLSESIFSTFREADQLEPELDESINESIADDDKRWGWEGIGDNIIPSSREMALIKKRQAERELKNLFRSDLNPQEKKNIALSFIRLPLKDKTTRSWVSNKMTDGLYASNNYILAELGHSEIKLYPDEVLEILEKFIINGDDNTLPILATIASRYPKEAAAFLSGRIKESHSDDEKRSALFILFHLETDNLSIRDNGTLNYFGLELDIEETGPESSAQRITADGKLGVFNDSKVLEGFVQLEKEDFATDERVKKEVTKISKDLLFYPKADETEHDLEQRDRIAKAFCEHYFNTFINLFSKQSEIRFNDFSLKEQGWCLLYLDNQNDSGKKHFFKFAEMYKEDGIRSLVAMEYGVNLGEEIINLSEQIGIPAAREFYRHFSKIISAAEEIGESVEETFKNGEFQRIEFISAQVTEAILRKNKDFIKAAVEIKKGDIQIEELISSMEEFYLVLDEISSAIKDQSQYAFVGKNDSADFTTWMVKDESKGSSLNITIRPEPGSTTINNSAGVKETIKVEPGIRITFVWPDKKRFGIRLDLDPYYKDEQFQNGRLSLDIGSRESKIAKILDRIAPEEGGHHNIQSFSPELSDPEVFKRLCLGLNKYFETLFAKAQ